MKSRTCLPYLFLMAALSILGAVVVLNPPGGIPWPALVSEPVPALQKLSYFSSYYFYPALYSFVAISLLQLQFRLTATGISTVTTFSICILASISLVAALRSAALGPAAGPAYALGMATSYTVMSRIYAIRMKRVWNRLQVPKIIWRGNAEAVAEVNREAVEQRKKIAAHVGI